MCLAEAAPPPDGLQELLEFTLVHQAQLAGDDELFGEEEAPVGDAPAGGAAQQASGGSGEASAAAVGCGGA